MVAESVTDNAASDRHSEFDRFLDHNDLARQRSDEARNRQRAVAVGQGDIGNGGLLSRRGQRQRGADDVENAVGVAKRGLDRNPGKNALVRSGDDHMPAGGEAPCRNETGQQALQAADGGGAILPDLGDVIDALGQQIGDRRQVALDRRALLPALVDHLHECAKTNGNQEGNDQGGHGAAKRGLGYQQPMIGWFRDRLRQSLDRIGLHARARRVCTRHALAPMECCKIYCTRFGTAPGHFRITAI